jgi:hypothetical protein
MATTSVDGSCETNEIGRITGESQVDGTKTVAGTQTHEDVGTVTTADDGTEKITEVGTESGTADHEMITTDGDETETM